MDEKLLDDWRRQIDLLDDEFFNILEKRAKIVKKIGKFKKEHAINVLDEKRWQEILRSKLSKAQSLNLPQEFIKKLYGLIHKYSLEIENRSK